MAALAAGMVAAGCGSSSKSSTTSQVSFKSGFATSQQDFRTLGTDIAKDITGAGNKTDAAIAAEFGKLATRASQQADQLAALHVPARYEKQVARMVSGFHAVKGDLTNIATAATQVVRDASVPKQIMVAQTTPRAAWSIRRS